MTEQVNEYITTPKDDLSFAGALMKTPFVDLKAVGGLHALATVLAPRVEIGVIAEEDDGAVKTSLQNTLGITYDSIEDNADIDMSSTLGLSTSLDKGDLDMRLYLLYSTDETYEATASARFDPHTNRIYEATNVDVYTTLNQDDLISAIRLGKDMSVYMTSDRTLVNIFGQVAVGNSDEHGFGASAHAGVAAILPISAYSGIGVRAGILCNSMDEDLLAAGGPMDGEADITFSGSKGCMPTIGGILKFD